MAYLHTNIRPIAQMLYSVSAAIAAVDRIIASLSGRRQIGRGLKGFSEHYLKDAGLTPGDVQSIRSMPLSADVATELSIRASQRSGNW